MLRHLLTVFSDRGHAPRERVSWNADNFYNINRFFVTLHVSVWVEIVFQQEDSQCNLSRSTWACELKSHGIRDSTHDCRVTLHVSVWVEMIPIEVVAEFVSSHAPRERVSWNGYDAPTYVKTMGHAPRERVSWNPDKAGYQ